jgi:hypothetical protein
LRLAVDAADQLERHDRVVRVFALQLGQHSGHVRAIHVAGQLRDYHRCSNKPALADERLGVQNLFIKRSGYVSERHVVSPFERVSGAVCHGDFASKDG